MRRRLGPPDDEQFPRQWLAWAIICAIVYLGIIGVVLWALVKLVLWAVTK